MSFFPSNTLWLHIIGYQTNFYTAFRLGILFLLSYYLRKLFSVNHPAKISSFEPPMLPYVLPGIFVHVKSPNRYKILNQYSYRLEFYPHHE